MVKSRFKLISAIPAADEKEEMFKGYHSFWKQTNRDSKASFVPLYTSFKDKHLATLEPGALRLYIFFAMVSQNQYGDSWYSVERIADFFDTQTRTVNNWIKILVDKNLIYREKKGKRSHTTYLIPYSSTIINHQLKKDIEEDNQSVLEMLVKKIKSRESLYGPVLEVFHLFQWKTNVKKQPIKKSTQWLFIITQRTDGVLIGHNYSLKNSDHFGVSELKIDEDIATFISPFKYAEQSIKGLALTHEVKMNNKNIGAIVDLMENLAKAEVWDWDETPKVTYGKLEDLLPDEEIREEELKDE